MLNVMIIPRNKYGKLKRATLRWTLATLASTLILWGAWGLESNFKHPYQMGGPFSLKLGPLFAIDVVPILVNVAFVTLLERKIFGYSQFRLGPTKSCFFFFGISPTISRRN